ncbi:MAG: hypothetical protein DMG57_22245 [Acidobacteria bacterium]|nr:MAG: hypothetical protein DMG57_22245 [Acidobacteriota bacterium]
MLVIPEAKVLAVSCSDSDSISLIHLETSREIRRIDLRPVGGTLSGCSPTRCHTTTAGSSWRLPA